MNITFLNVHSNISGGQWINLVIWKHIRWQYNYVVLSNYCVWYISLSVELYFQRGTIWISMLFFSWHYNDVIMDAIASQITSLTIVYSTVYSDADQRKHQSSVSLNLCAGNSPGTGEFPAQMASNAENVSIWRRHHGIGHSWNVRL